MGWFSSKKKTYVATEVTRLHKDKDIPNLHQKNVIDSVMGNDPMTRTIINNALTSQTLKLERAYRKAARGEYYYGTPNHNIRNAADGRDVLQNILEIKHGVSVRLDYFHFAPLNNLHYAWQILTEQYGYDEFRNTLVYEGTRYWVKDVVGQINTVAITSDETAEDVQELAPDEGTLELWDRHPQDRYTPHRASGEKTPIWLFGSDVADGAMVYLVDADGNETTVFVDTVGFDRDLECFHAKYQYVKGGKRYIDYFTYEYNQGAYPTLDAVHNRTAVGKGTFFPIFIFRSGDKNMTASKYHGTAAYKSSVKLANSIGLDYQHLGDMVNEQEGADDLEQAVLMMGVPAKTGNAVEAEYLFRFFDWLYKQNGNTSSSLSSRSLNTTRPGKSITISERDFECTLSFSSLNRKHHTGRIGKVGTYDCREITATRYRTFYRRTKTEVEVGGKTAYVTVSYRIPYKVSGLEYRYQATANSYQSLWVNSLKLRYHIYGSKGIDANVGSDKLLIPIDYYIARSMRYAKKDQLYYRSMHFVFNSRITKRVKWYQSGWFQIVLVIVAIAITIFTGGAGSPISAAITSGAYAAAALMILQAIASSFLIGLAVSEVTQFVIKEFGIEAGALLAVVAFVAAAYGGNVSASWSTAAIQAGNNIVRTSLTAYQQQQLADYNAERQEFDLLKATQIEDLEEAQNLLQQYPLLDPRSFIGQEPELVPGESPESLYQRTVHVGNPGILQYDYIESYVALNTRLPTFNDLVGETFV